MATTLIAVGSHDFEQAKTVDYYNPNSDSWTELHGLNVENRGQFKCEMLNGKLMLVGGFEHGHSSTIVQAYDYYSKTLTDLAPTKYRRNGHGIAVVDNSLYVFGGFDDGYLNQVEKYNPWSDEWTDVQPMTIGKYDFGVAVYNGEIYLVGGTGEDHYSLVEAYNPNSGSWRTCASMNEKRGVPAVTTFRNMIYAVGGQDGEKALQTVERYDPNINQWSYIDNVSIPRHTSEAISYNDTLIVAGGFDPLISNSVEAYNGYWSKKGSLTSARAFFTLLEVPWTLIKYIQTNEPKK